MQLSRPKYSLNSARRLLLLLVVIALGAGGCGFLGLDDPASAPTEGSKPPAAPAAAPAEQASAEAADAVVEPDYERPDYPDQIRRNPFLPDMSVVRPAHTVARDEVRAKDPLEKYSLSQLTLVAIISEVAVPKAMLLDPEGFGHVVKEGDRVGLNGGTISDIHDNEVEVREVSEGLKTETRMTTLKLRSDQLRQRDADELSDEEREALRRLLDSEEGRRAAQERLKQGSQASDSSPNAPAPGRSEGRGRE